MYMYIYVYDRSILRNRFAFTRDLENERGRRRNAKERSRESVYRGEEEGESWSRKASV